MFSRKSSQKPTKQPIYPAGKYSTQSSSSIGIPPPAPPLSRLSSVKPIPPLQSSQYPSSNSFYQNILSGLGLGMGASLGRGIVDKGLGSHTNDEVKIIDVKDKIKLPSHFCKKELEDYEESVIHFLHYNDYSVEEFYTKYKDCLEKHSKQVIKH